MYTDPIIMLAKKMAAIQFGDLDWHGCHVKRRVLAEILLKWKCHLCYVHIKVLFFIEKFVW